MQQKKSHVVKLDLRARSLIEFSEGQINSSLFGLQHLIYLDLSNNDFNGQPLLEFLGSLAKLQYLNLSSTNIGGAIPQ